MSLSGSQAPSFGRILIVVLRSGEDSQGKCPAHLSPMDFDLLGRVPESSDPLD
ncbi:hypothetical protein [Ferrimicrobium acidiphilum]|uniref:hypothetical protein n=1 Tax=Ferrimicrobium acidiphilum TaxID=121039 RepID=UPI0023F51A88|nr:hypothetical protein [Ferrimicrobium acidiphilum]